MRTLIRNRRGNAVVEFALAASIMVPAIIGASGVGMQLGRSIQVAQVTRDAAKMYFTGVDFTVTANQKILGRLAYGLGLASDAGGTINPSGNGVLILSRVVKVGATECILGGYSTGVCPNKGALVVTRRVVVGNSSLRASEFGIPGSTFIQANGDINPADYADEVSVIVPFTAPTQHLGLLDGQYTFIAESFFKSPAMAGFKANQSYSFNMM